MSHSRTWTRAPHLRSALPPVERRSVLFVTLSKNKTPDSTLGNASLRAVCPCLHEMGWVVFLGFGHSLGKIPRAVTQFPRARSSVVVRHQWQTVQTHNWHSACKQSAPTCKPLTPSKSHPQPCSAVNGGGSVCCNFSKRSNVGHGVARPRRPFSFHFPKTTCAANGTASSRRLGTEPEEQFI